MRRLLCLFALASLLGCHEDDDCDDCDVAFAGFPATDFNRDGRADFLVGAPLDDAGVAGSNRGRVFLYAGGVGPDTVVDQIYNGTEADGQFGASVAAIGDYNGDGYADFAVGAPFEDAGGTDRGRVYVYFGGPFFPAVPSVTLSGTQDGGRFGTVVARAGDVDRDGRSDLLVGAPFETAAGTSRGRAHLFTFADGTTPLVTYDGVEDDSRFGLAVDTAGDMNGDGFYDVAIGAPLEDAGGTDRGRVRIYFGGLVPNNVPDLPLDGTVDGGQFGASVAGLLDYNSDGFADLAVGAPFDDRVFVYFGSPVPNAVADRTLIGAAGTRFGALVARIGDINAGGAPDLLVGAPFSDAAGAAGSERGRAFVYFGGPSTDLVADVTLSGAVDGAHFGSSGFSGGDSNADGYRDLVIGAPNDDTNGVDAGRVFYFRGGAFLDAIADTPLDGGPEAGAQAGASVQ